MATNKNQIQSLNSFITSYIDKLKAKAPQNTGTLANSFTGEFNVVNDGFDIGIDAMAYAKFVDAGVNGTEVDRGSIFSYVNRMVPIASVQNIADSVGVSPYAIAKSIQRNGIRPTLFATNTIENEVNNFGDDMAKAIWDDFNVDNKEPEKQNKLNKTIK
jgi:hypothetical protein